MNNEAVITPQKAIEALRTFGWSLELIAKGTTLTQPTISRIAKGADPSWKNGQKIIRLLKIYVEDLT